VPPPQKGAALARWRDASFGLFLDFGVYSTFRGEYGGGVSDAYGEWLMHDVKIPLAEYRNKVDGVFNPKEFNAEEFEPARIVRNLTDASEEIAHIQCCLGTVLEEAVGGRRARRGPVWVQSPVGEAIRVSETGLRAGIIKPA
jgi:hypothetical protein